MKKLLVIILLLLGTIDNLSAKHKANSKKVLSNHGKELQIARKQNLSFIRNTCELQKFKHCKLLKPLPSKKIKIDCRLCSKHRYAREWTNKFIVDFSVAFKRKFGRTSNFIVTSAVRTEDYQRNLRRRNNAAAVVSTHLTGATFDVTKNHLNYKQNKWIRSYLISCQFKGYCILVNERYCFHVFVSRTYRGLQKV